MSKAAILNFPEPKEARLYYFDKKTNRLKRLSDNIFRDLQYVTRPNDRPRRISLKARNLLTNLIQMILKNPHKEEFVDHIFLSQITEVGSSQQNARLLYQISDIIDSTYHSYINFHGKNRTYGYVIKLTEDGYERAKNPIAFYDDSDEQKCLPRSTKMFTRVNKNVEIYKDKENPEEEINHSYANGFISEKEKTYKKEKAANELHATFAPGHLAGPEQVAPIAEQQNKSNQSVTNSSQLTAREEKAVETQHKERTSENTGLFTMSDLMTKIFNKPEALPKQEEITKMNQGDIVQTTDEQTRKMLLSQTLWKAFGEERAGEIQDGCIFRELESDKIGIYTGDMLLSDVEKAKIRKAIGSVYGDNVQVKGLILPSKAKEQELPSNENIPASTYPVSKKATWLDFKATIKTNSMITMLTNPVLKTIEIPGKVIIETVPFLIERLTSPGYLDELERSVFETGLTLELRTSNTHPEYKNFNKEAIVLTPEKILKDQEFQENCKPLILNEILNELKNKEEQNNE